MSLLPSGAIETGGYDINNSLRFRSSASAYLSRTPGSAGNRRTWTLSMWFKLGALPTADNNLYRSSSDAGANQIWVYFNSSNSNALNFGIRISSTNYQLQIAPIHRDPSAWYHLVYAVDTTQATSSNRAKIYINGEQVTNFISSSYPPQNSDTSTNNTGGHALGSLVGGGGYYDGYMAEINFIDGQALTPSSFGSTNATTGVWQPAKYTGTYGTNGFYLKFSDIATTSGSNAGLGKDFSGNSNYWTTNNISVTSGVTYDAMTDSPTNTSATVANYCTLNPLRNTASSQGTFSNANLKISGTTGTINCVAAGTMAFSGKMYCEMTIQVRGNNTTTQGVGIVPISSNESNRAGTMSTGIYYLVDGNKRVTGTSSAYGSSYTSGDVIGIAVDTSAETVTFYKNNVSQGSISGTGVISAQVFPYIGFEDSGSPEITANFGQRPFAYTPPTGFVALNTFNLPAASISNGAKHFAATTYTGNGGTQTVSNGNFQPDFVWIKNRAAAVNHQLHNSNVGWQYGLNSNNTNAEYTDANAITGATSTGWSMNNNYNSHNQSGVSFIGWQWQAGQGTTSSNTSGSITSTVSVNTTAGFSVVTYTGNGTAGATVGHGLGVAPKMFIVKNRVQGTYGNWNVWHTALSGSQYLTLNATDAAGTNNNRWNGTVPTSTVFYLGADSFGNTNKSGDTYVAYCWAAISGFSAFGSYTGNGSSDGSFVYVGFKPKYVMIKRTDSADDWIVIDSARNTYNVANSSLFPNGSYSETTDANRQLDFLSNGFKVRSSPVYINANGGTYIYACFASNPFKNSNAA